MDIDFSSDKQADTNKKPNPTTLPMNDLDQLQCFNQLLEKHQQGLQMLADRVTGLQEQLETQLLAMSAKLRELEPVKPKAERRLSVHISLPLARAKVKRALIRILTKGARYTERLLKKIYRHAPMPQGLKLTLKKLYIKSKTILKNLYLPLLPTHPSDDVLLAAQEDGVADVFIWAVIDWHFRTQRPQHLARGFAELGHRVFYFSSDLIVNPTPGFKIEKLDDKLELYCIRLYVSAPLQIYYSKATPNALQQLKSSMACFYQWSHSHRVYSIVQHPFWLDLVERLPNQTLVYDCMDHHAGFKDNASEILALEERLIEQADLLVVTSQWLYQELASKNLHISLIRNAGDFAYFANRPSESFADGKARKIIGYYGAIAEWFDIELVASIAEKFTDCLLLLVGDDTAHVKKRLSQYGNVLMTGEVSYQKLPYYLHAMDVCLIPFKVIPLTLATNPVKAYEYLSAGKPVVSVDLPELHEFSGTVSLAKNHQQFLDWVEHYVTTKDAAVDKQSRVDFAKNQTWACRVAKMDTMIQAQAYPLISIIIVTYNNLPFTKACLASIERFTHYPNYEVIIVDNQSSDGSPTYLKHYTEKRDNYHFIANEANLGFAAANNQGLKMAQGDYLVLLNNDTYVTDGWLGSLYRHFKRHAKVGMVGPVTNNIGNEAKIDIHYSNMEEMAVQAKAVTSQNMGEGFVIRSLAFFCVMISRQVYTEVGDLDESFGVGMFEDDDYCQRVSQLGYQMLCADDVFIHHHLSASFDALGASRKQELFEKNKAIFEAKWGKWIPHRYRHH